MEKNNEKQKELILKLTEEVKKKNKIIWSCMWIIMAESIIALLFGVFAAMLIPDGAWEIVAIIAVCFLFLIPCFYALKLEVSVGAYECKKCGEKIVPTYSEALWAMHRGTTRYLKCPKCGRRTWCKKVINKD